MERMVHQELLVLMELLEQAVVMELQELLVQMVVRELLEHQVRQAPTEHRAQVVVMVQAVHQELLEQVVLVLMELQEQAE